MIGANSECVRSQVVYILTAINPEVRAIISGASVNPFIDGSNASTAGPGHGDGGRRQSARRHTVQCERESYGHNTASDVEDTSPI